MNHNDPKVVVINAQSALGGAVYPIIERLVAGTDMTWKIVTYSLDLKESEKRSEHPRYYDEPTFVWVKDNGVTELFIEMPNGSVMPYEIFAMLTGLRVEIDSVGFKTSKRISRVMRPQFVTGFFPVDSVNIVRRDDWDNKLFDGAGLVSRKMLLRMIDHLPAGITQSKRRRLRAVLRKIERVEFTILGPNGEEKGHVSVVDTDEYDFMIPVDAKEEIFLEDGTILVCFDTSFKAKNEMLLDAQSSVNLYPFVKPKMLGRWMLDEALLYNKSVRDNSVADLLSRVDSDMELDNIQKWHIHEYVASGGKPMWFRSIAKSFYNQHISRILNTFGIGMRYPVPGGRYYVMTESVAREAGYENVSVARGEIMLDYDRGTAWVNDEDWVEYLAAIWGGADMDDALWIIAFTDYDGTKKILAWRSPNQLGEYALLKPTANSTVIEWESQFGTISYPKMDSRDLPKLKGNYDSRIIEGLILEIEKRDPVEYTVAGMEFAKSRARANAGVLGMTCNILLLYKALYESVPGKMFGELEDIIDAIVKNGNDISGVRAWALWMAQNIKSAARREVNPVLVPASIVDRIPGVVMGQDKQGYIPLSTDHWLDELHAITVSHINFVETLREQAAQNCAAPVDLIQHVHEMGSLDSGIGLTKVYNSIISSAIRTKGRPEDVDFEVARQQSEVYLSMVDDREETLLGALYAAQKSDRNDSVAWQIAGDNGTAIASETIEALRRIGILGDLTVTDEGLVLFPADMKEPFTSTVVIQLSGVWYNLMRVNNPALEYDMGQCMKFMRKESLKAKSQVAAWAKSGVLKGTYRVVTDESGNKVVYGKSGNVMAFVARKHADLVKGDTITILDTGAEDGNILAVCA